VRRLTPVAVLLLATAAVSAHALSVSYAQFIVSRDAVSAVVRLPLDDVDLLLRLDRDLDGRVSDVELAGAAATLQGYIDIHLRVRADDRPVSGRVTRLARWRDPAAALYLEVAIAYAAPRAIERLSIESDVLTEL
jgi:hypothetical protein